MIKCDRRDHLWQRVDYNREKYLTIALAIDEQPQWVVSLCRCTNTMQAGRHPVSENRVRSNVQTPKNVKVSFTLQLRGRSETTNGSGARDSRLGGREGRDIAKKRKTKEKPTELRKGTTRKMWRCRALTAEGRK